MKLKSISIEGIGHNTNNMTLGVHAQDFDKNGYQRIHYLYIGFFFFRIVFEFIYN